MNANPHLWEYRWVRDLITLVVVALVLVAAYSVRAIIAPVLVGLVLAYLFNPLVTLSRRRWQIPRWTSTAVIMLLGVLVIIALLLFIVPELVRQTQNLIEAAGGYIETINQFLRLKIEQAKEIATQTIAPGTTDRPEETGTDLNFQAVGGLIVRVLGIGFDLINSAINLTVYLGLVLVVVSFCFFWFAWKFDLMIAWFSQFIPARNRQITLDLLARMDRTIAAFVRGRLIQALVMGLVLSVGWWLFDVPYWLLLGLLAGTLNLAPFVASLGWLAALILAGVDHASAITATNLAAETAAKAQLAAELGIPVAQFTDAQITEALARVSQESFRIMVIVWPTLIYLVAQGLDGWVVEPLVQGKATDLDPLTVLLAVLIGGALAGLLGMLIAIPVAACIKILSQEILLPRLRTAIQESPG